MSSNEHKIDEQGRKFIERDGEKLFLHGSYILSNVPPWSLDETYFFPENWLSILRGLLEYED